LPHQDSIFHTLAGFCLLSALDCNQGYHQIGLTKQSQKLTAFVTKDGFWDYLRVPFGLKNTPAHFQHTIDIILGADCWDFILAYIDDILIFSQTFEDHMKHVSLVLDSQ